MTTPTASSSPVNSSPRESSIGFVSITRTVFGLHLRYEITSECYRMGGEGNNGEEDIRAIHRPRKSKYV